MTIALSIFAVFIVIASGSAVIFPSEILAYAREALSGHSIWWAASARAILAVLLWFSASASRTPKTFKVLAVVAAMSAAFLVVIGTDGILEIIDRFDAMSLWAIRLLTCLGVAFGLFMLWSLHSKR